MRFASIQLLLLFNLATFGSAGIDHALFLTSQDPVLQNICSSSLVRIEDRVFLNTANHCINYNTPIAIYRDVLARDGILESGELLTELEGEELLSMYSFHDDSTFFELNGSENIGDTPILSPSDEVFLNKGDSLGLVGFGGGYGPQSLACRYVGYELVIYPRARDFSFNEKSLLRALLDFWPGENQLKFIPSNHSFPTQSLYGVAECDLPVGDAHTFQGFSGGSLVDQKGHFVGNVSRGGIMNDKAIAIFSLSFGLKLNSKGEIKKNKITINNQDYLWGNYISVLRTFTRMIITNGLYEIAFEALEDEENLVEFNENEILHLNSVIRYLEVNPLPELKIPSVRKVIFDHDGKTEVEWEIN